MTDWDRTIRHGILPTGRPSAMPSEDFQLMSDQELSDIIAYIRSFPPVDNVVAPPSLGPVGTVLMATGKLRLSCDVIRAHDADHPTLPPPTEPTPEFGRHLAGVCTGCHRHDLNGGPIAAGPPDWLPAANLTPHADGLGEWQYEDFATAMREMRRPDGSEIRVPMSLMAPYTAEMTDVELQALWAYLQTLEATPTGTD
jgi:mono/diheme cytochrome c family protein